MRRCLAFFVAGITCFLVFAAGTAMAGIHFLAIDVPPDTAQDVVKNIQPRIQKLIKAQVPEYSDKILYHTADNIHISLIRFNEIPADSLSFYIALFNKDVEKLPSNNIADKLREAKLDVTKSGYIVYVFPEPKSLTKFVTALLEDMDNARPDPLYYNDTDFEKGGKVFPHFSIGKFDPNVVSVEKMRKILKGNVPAPVCRSFKLDKFCLKHSEEPKKQLCYTNEAVFPTPPSKGE